MLKVLSFILLLAMPLAACGSDPQTAPGSPIDVSGAITGEKAKKSLYVISAGVVALGDLALSYANLPRCPTGAPACSQQEIVNQMAKAYRQASDTLDKAEAFIKATPSGDAGDVLRAANVAMAAFQSLALANNIPNTVPRS